MRPIRPPTPPEETEPIMIHISREEFFRYDIYISQKTNYSFTIISDF